MFPNLAIWQWTLAAFCAFNIGMAKTGVPGLGILAVPLFVLAVGDARLSAGWLLPILLMADLFAVVAYRRHPAAKNLFGLLPSVVVGLATGAFVLSYPERIIRPLLGAIVLLILILFLLRRRGIDLTPANSRWHSPFYGAVAGFATMVANAAGPIMNIYMLTKGLKGEAFVATGAWFFFLVNLSKIPVYTAQHMMSWQSLAFDVALAPPTIAGAILGRKVLAKLPEHVFVNTVIVLAFAATIALMIPR